MRVGSAAHVHVEGFTCVSRGLRAHSGVNARTTPHDRHRCAQNADHFAISSPLSAFFTEVVCDVGATPPRTAATPAPNGGNCAIQGCDTPATRRKKASHGAKPPPATGLENAGGPGRPGRSAREQRGAAIARQLAQGLRQSTALFAQQQPRRAPSVQNSPRTPALAACAVQNSPSTPEMAQFGAFSACRESFIPLWLAQHQAGRILYRMRGRVGASHDSTTRPTSAEDTRGVAGPGRGAGCGRLAGPARVRRATTTQISHIISHGHFSRPPENVAIPTTHIQCLNKLRGNYVRN